MYIALCSVKDTEGERNTGFFLAVLLLILYQSSLSLPPSFSLIFHCTPCVLVFIQMFEFEWHFLLRLCTSGLTRLIYILHPWEKKKRKKKGGGEQKAAESIGRQTGCVRAPCLLFGFGSLTGPSAVAV